MWLTKKEVCKMLYIHINTLNRWMKQGKIPYYKMGNERTARVKFRQNDIKLLLEKYKR